MQVKGRTWALHSRTPKIQKKSTDTSCVETYSDQINNEHSLYATYKINLTVKYTLTQLRKIRYLFYSRIY